MKRVFCFLVDQLTGHWEKSVRIEGTDLPPANVIGYHRLGLIPNFSYLIENGLWVRKPWNKGRCDTLHGMKYIATGSYLEDKYFEPQNWRPCYCELMTQNYISFPIAVSQYYKQHDEEFVASVFGSLPWTDDFLFNDCYATYRPWDSGDDVMLRNYALPWLKSNPDWNLSIIYFQGLDEIGDRGCPSYIESDSPRSSKHSYIKFLDTLIGEVTEFLKEENLWEETYIMIISDHGAHLGCSWIAKNGIMTNNWWQGHSEPWDCEVWDFKNNKSTGVYSGGPRRTTFILSGGALEKKFRGKYIEEAQIIDVAPTIAHLFGVPFKCQGKSILEGYKIKAEKK